VPAACSTSRLSRQKNENQLKVILFFHFFSCLTLSWALV